MQLLAVLHKQWPLRTQPAPATDATPGAAAAHAVPIHAAPAATTPSRPAWRQPHPCHCHGGHDSRAVGLQVGRMRHMTWDPSPLPQPLTPLAWAPLRHISAPPPRRQWGTTCRWQGPTRLVNLHGGACTTPTCSPTACRLPPTGQSHSQDPQVAGWDQGRGGVAVDGRVTDAIAPRHRRRRAGGESPHPHNGHGRPTGGAPGGHHAAWRDRCRGGGGGAARATCQGERLHNGGQGSRVRCGGAVAQPRPEQRPATAAQQQGAPPQRGGPHGEHGLSG